MPAVKKFWYTSIPMKNWLNWKSRMGPHGFFTKGEIIYLLPFISKIFASFPVQCENLGSIHCLEPWHITSDLRNLCFLRIILQETPSQSCRSLATTYSYCIKMWFFYRTFTCGGRMAAILVAQPWPANYKRLFSKLNNIFREGQKTTSPQQIIKLSD